MKDEVTVVDTPEEVHDLETATAFDEGFSLDRNHASDQAVAERALRVVGSCLQQSEGHHQERVARWRRMDDLWRQESLSARARDFDVHMGGPYRAVEEYATKMEASVFGQKGIVRGEPEDIEDAKRASLATALVEEQMIEEAQLKRRGLAHFREVGIFGNKIGKVIPKKRVQRMIARDVVAAEIADRTIYRFKKPKEESVAWTEMQVVPVSVFDFRIPDTASTIEDAGWCGDFSYPTSMDLDECVIRKVYDAAAVERIKEKAKKAKGSTHTGPLPYQQTTAWQYGSSASQLQGEKPDEGPHILQFSCFEWWGDFDLKGDGDPVPCVITVVMPSNENLTLTKTPMNGEVVRITRNPYFHQKKPYAHHPFMKREGEFWSPSLMEVVARHSIYEDELAVLGLLGAYWESSPMLEIGESSGVSEADIDGFMPGKIIHSEEVGHIAPITTPVRSGVAVQMSQYFAQNSQDVAGLGSARAAPRVPAAGIVDQNAQKDDRLRGFINSCENYWLIEIAEFFHAYNQQYMTRERKIKTLGVKGLHAPDMTIVKPTDVLVGMRFQPTVGLKLAQRAFQSQVLVNWWDRAVQSNMLRAQMQQPPLFNLDEMAGRIFTDVFGITDIQNLVFKEADPEQLRSAHEEHRLIALGEKVTVQRNEKTYLHLDAHLDFLENGGADSWAPSRQQALRDHIRDTIYAFYRQIEQSQPGTGEVVAGLYGQRLDALGGSSMGPGLLGDQAAGGRGVAQGTQAPTSPIMRPIGTPEGVPRPTQGETGAGTFNMGAA